MNIYKNGKYKVDSYRVKQYENERIVCEVEVIEDCKYKKFILCYSESLRANLLVPRKDIFEL
jgi:hypothetical protein